MKTTDFGGDERPSIKAMECTRQPGWADLQPRALGNEQRTPVQHANGNSTCRQLQDTQGIYLIEDRSEKPTTSQI